MDSAGYGRSSSEPANFQCGSYGCVVVNLHDCDHEVATQIPPCSTALEILREKEQSRVFSNLTPVKFSGTVARGQSPRSYTRGTNSEVQSMTLLFEHGARVVSAIRKGLQGRVHENAGELKRSSAGALQALTVARSSIDLSRPRSLTQDADFQGLMCCA